jgi:uncharacterized DUF497 family protein
MYVHPVHTLISFNQAALPGAAVMLFEWDESKQKSNLAKHGIDFQDAIRIFDGPVFEKASRVRGENRIMAIGLLEDIEIVAIYVIRGKGRRLISARRGPSQ